MSWLDGLLIVVFILSVFSGFRSGFIRSLFRFFGLLLAIMLGWRYSDNLVHYFERTWELQTRLADYLAEQEILPHRIAGLISPGADYADFASLLLTVLGFVVIFVAVRVLADVLSHMGHRTLSWGLTGLVNHLLGGVFALMTTVMTSAVILVGLLMLAQYASFLEGFPRVIEESQLARELVRAFFQLGPLQERLGEGPVFEALEIYKGG